MRFLSSVASRVRVLINNKQSLRFGNSLSRTLCATLALTSAQAFAAVGDPCPNETPPSQMVTGSLSGTTVWGKNTSGYKSNSDLARAAVHAGLLAPGVTGFITVSPLDVLGSFTGSTANGITSNSYASPYCAIRLSGGVTKTAQTITFGSLPNKIIGDAAFTVSASASSGLPVAFSSATPLVCSVSGSAVTLVSAGTCTIDANQAGDTTYAAAPKVSQSFGVSQKTQTISFPSLPNRTLGTGPYTLSATATSGLPVTFTSLTASVCTVSGTSVSLTTAGTCNIAANQAGNTAYAAAPQTSQSFLISSPTLTAQTITFPALTNKVLGAGTFSVSASSSSGLTVVFSSLTPAVCTISGTTGTLVSAGTCAIAADQGGNVTYAAAPRVQQSFSVYAPSDYAVEYPGIAVTATGVGVAPGTTYAAGITGSARAKDVQLGDTVTKLELFVDGVVQGSARTYTVTWDSSHEIVQNTTRSFTMTAPLAAGEHNVFVRGTTFYGGHTDSATLKIVILTNQSISFGTLTNKLMGDPAFGVAASSSSGLPVAFSSSTPAVCGVSGATVTLLGAGTCTVAANQGGNTSYAPAPQVTQSFLIEKRPQTIDFAALPSRVLGSSAFTLGASASSGLPVAYASTTPAQCTVSGTSVSLIAMGTCSITASQSGSAVYLAAAPVIQAFAVTSSVSAQTIDFPSIADKPLGTAPFTVTATASSGLPVTLTSKTASCSVSGTIVTLASVGTCSLAANQSGNGSYSAAPEVVRSFNIGSALVPNNATFVSQSLIPSSMRAGQPYLLSVTMKNTGSASWPAGGAFKLGSQGPQDNWNWGVNRFVLPSAVASGQTVVFSMAVTAPLAPGSYAFQWRMVQEGVAWFGDSTPNAPVAVVAGTGPVSTLAATPTNVRMAGLTPATVTLSGTGSQAGSTIAKLELYVDSGSGYTAIPVKTVTGAASSLTLSHSASLNAGVYRYKLRSTNSAGDATDSQAVVVNVTNSALLGQTNGVRINAAGNPELAGWVCQSGASQALAYQVFLDAPTPASGGVLLASGSAGVATEADNAAVQSTCSTPGAGHHFIVDLTPYTAAYAGRSLYVLAQAVGGSSSIALPCNDNTCTVPGTMRIALSSPSPQNTDEKLAPATVFMRAVVSGAAAPFDDVAFSFDGGPWIAGAADGTIGAYYANQPGVAARATPYLVEARVRKGNTTVYSMKNAIKVVTTLSATLNLTQPVNGSTVTLGAQVPMTAALSGSVPSIQSVKFFDSTGTVLGTGVASGSGWTANWTAGTAGAVTIQAKAFDSANVELLKSAPVTITVASGGSGSGATPIPVVVPNAELEVHKDRIDAGSLPGSLGVTPSGAATYGISIVVPPGTAGVQPDLSLGYNSQGTNSMLGVGWSLGGLSRIHRCGKTIAQDDINDRIRFAPSDRLCLDGQRLVLVNLPVSDANYWAANAEYRTEIDSFSRITAQSGTWGLYFKVETKDGRINTYGNSPSSNLTPVLDRAAGTNSPTTKGAQAWAIDSSRDKFGNFIKFDYDYSTDTGEHVPDVIRYGSAGNNAHAAVKFTYAQRQDAWTRYIDETRNDQRRRLTGIKTYVGSDLSGDPAVSGTIVRKYAVSYEYSLTSGRSLLNMVEVQAWNAARQEFDKLPPTTFDWGKPDPLKVPGFESKGVWQGAPVLTTNVTVNGNTSWKMHPEFFAFNDFENHGLTDVLEKQVAQLNADKSGTSYNPIPGGTLQTQYRYFSNTGTQFVEYKYQLNTLEKFAVLDIGDFDGNGAPDLLVRTEANGMKICLSPLGGSSGTLAFQRSKVIPFTCGTAPQWPVVELQGTAAVDDMPYVVDVKGDGRAGHYSRIHADGTANLCVQSSCTTDSNAPAAVLGMDYLSDGTPEFALHDYSKFSQMVDYAGVGKPYDTRWSKPHWVDKKYDSGGPIIDRTWHDMTPTITLSNFNMPGTVDPAHMTSYEYPIKYLPLPGGQDGIGLAPYMFDFPGSIKGSGYSADLNGSGLNGLLFGFVEFGGDGVTYNKAELTQCLSTGRGLKCSVRKKFSGSAYHLVLGVGNFVGDGMPGILVRAMTIPVSGAPQPSNVLKMCRLMGDDTTQGASVDDANMKCDAWAGTEAITSSADQVFMMDLYGTGRPQMVRYHPGTPLAGGGWSEDGRWEVFAPIDLAKDKQALDRIHQVTNGLESISSVEYADGIPSGVVKTSNATPQYAYPVHLTGSTGKVVSRLRQDNGSEPQLTTKFEYFDAAADLQGRGSLGFAKVISAQEKPDLTGAISTTTTLYQQAWPTTGMVLRSTTTVGEVTVADTTNRLGVNYASNANGTSTVFTYIGGSTSDRRDLDGSNLGRTVLSGTSGAAYNVSYDRWGNLLNSQTVVSWPEGSSMATHTTQQVNTYVPASATNWLNSLQASASTTTRHSVDGKSLVRSMAFTYMPDGSGRLQTSTIEPNNILLKVVTTLSYHPTFGVLTDKTETWRNPGATADSSRTEKIEYDSRGRFAQKATNALGLSDTSAHDAATGVRVSLTNANGLVTTWTVNGFGQVLTEKTADGNETRRYSKKCAYDCRSGEVVVSVQDRFNGNDRTAVPQLAYSDRLGRVLRTKTWGFDGSIITTDTSYDERGRQYATSQPYYPANTIRLAQRLGYDDLDRVTSVTTLSDSGAEVAATTTYNGLIRILKNPKNQQRTEQYNGMGKVVKVIDANLKSTLFAYDSQGNLAKTTDPLLNVVTIEYDVLGRKTLMKDPDLGEIRYTVDPLGRTVAQSSQVQRDKTATTGIDQTTNMAYDALGRMVARLEPDLKSYWVYDQLAGTDCKTTKSCGQLVETYTGSAAVKDYRRQHTYDVFGRPLASTESIGADRYLSQADYDPWGRLSLQTYQRGTDAVNAKRFGSRYNGFGYLARIERGPLVLWQVDTQYASQLAKAITLGNGLKQVTEVYEPTGRLSKETLSTAQQLERLKEAYTFDVLGNVLQRTQYWDVKGFIEDFEYDALNRLWTSQVSGQAKQTYLYNDAGGFVSKGGLGVDGLGKDVVYAYPAQGPAAIRPHGVTSIPGIGSFLYDNNGNLLQGAGRTTTWTSFDMPDLITKGSNSARFNYGSEHQRTRQTKQDGGVTLYAGAQEVEIAPGGQTTVRTYWPMGLGFEVDRPGTSVSELNWSHKDRLGSLVALSAADGTLRETMAYDAWGKRRTLNGAPLNGTPTPDSIDGNTDHRGFTGHEMLDQLDLVHMNGRVYDPFTAKFLSGDPIIQDPTNGQNYNRYSYVFNNPTNLTDPTGFSACANGKTVCPGMSLVGQNFTDLTTPALTELRQEAAAARIAAGAAAGGAARAASGGAQQDTNGNDKNNPKQGGSSANSGGERTWGSYLPGTEQGHESSMFWANRVNNSSFMEDPGARVGLSFSVLWTPDTAAETAFNLAGGEIISGAKLAVTYAGSKIVGAAQATGTLGHAGVSSVLAYANALNPNVARVTLDLGYKRLLEGTEHVLSKYGPRPDVGVLFHDGSVKVIEVASKTDKPAQLLLRNEQKMLRDNVPGSVSVNNWAVWINKVFGN